MNPFHLHLPMTHRLFSSASSFITYCLCCKQTLICSFLEFPLKRERSGNYFLTFILKHPTSCLAVCYNSHQNHWQHASLLWLWLLLLFNLQEGNAQVLIVHLYKWTVTRSSLVQNFFKSLIVVWTFVCTCFGLIKFAHVVFVIFLRITQVGV